VGDRTLADIWAAVEMIRVEVPNFSLDLISGLPLKQWQATLAAGVAIAPTHISIYDLQIDQLLLWSLLSTWCPAAAHRDTTVQMYRQG